MEKAPLERERKKKEPAEELHKESLQLREIVIGAKSGK